MKKILVLVDYTDTAATSLKQAIEIAQIQGAEITVLHVADSEVNKLLLEAEHRYEEYFKTLENEGLKFRIETRVGDFMNVIPQVIEAYKPDLVVVGTHGKKGIKQSLLGSNIYRLVKKIKSAVLVVNDHLPDIKGEFNRILMPVAAHENYLIKVRHAHSLLANGGSIILFVINKPGIGLSDPILKNMEAAKNYFRSNEIDWEYLEVDSNSFSIGYSKETLSLIKDQNVDLISIMTLPSDSSSNSSMIMDKENVILNKQGVAVLCSNE